MSHNAPLLTVAWGYHSSNIRSHNLRFWKSTQHYFFLHGQLLMHDKWIFEMKLVWECQTVRFPYNLTKIVWYAKGCPFARKHFGSSWSYPVVNSWNLPKSLCSKFPCLIWKTNNLDKWAAYKTVFFSYFINYNSIKWI